MGLNPSNYSDQLVLCQTYVIKIYEMLLGGYQEGIITLQGDHTGDSWWRLQPIQQVNFNESIVSGILHAPDDDAT